jgi:RNA recognition motif-containing protein
LAWRTSWQDLKNHFGTVGTVRYADVLREGGPGSRSKGCGIVEFETAEEAARAIQELNHSEIDGRAIFVREDREDYELKSAEGGGGEAGDGGGGRGGGAGRPPMQKRPRGPGGGRGGGGAVSIGRRVWVGNLDPSTTWQQLKDHFKQAGHVTHADIMADATGASKGCGIVEFQSSRDALHAISLLSNSALPHAPERNIVVREDREDPSMTRGGFGRGAGRGPAPRQAPEGTQLVVHGLPWRYAWQDLKDVGKQYGNVVRADVMMNQDGTSKGYGLVAFATQEEAAAALEGMNGMEVDGRTLSAKYDKFSGAPR